MTKLFACAAVLSLAAAPLMAQTWSSNAPRIGPVNKPEGMLIHPYPSSANYCPQGLQPITMGGVICCGTPTTSEPYYNRVSVQRSYPRYHCPPGTKGCY